MGDNSSLNAMEKAIEISKSMSKREKVISLALLIIVGTFTNYIYVLTVYVQPLSEAHGWSMNLIVLAYSMSMFIMIPAYAAGGWVTAKFGIKKILLASAAAYGLSILGSGLVTNVYAFIFFMGVLSSFALYGVFMASLSLINVMFPEKKGTAMGLLYGFQTLGAAAFSPLADFFITRYSVTASLVIQGIAFTIIMVVAAAFVKDPTRGNAELVSEIQKAADETEQAEGLAGKIQIPDMRWKMSLRNPAVYIILISMILIQMFGNAITSDSVYMATTYYGVSSTAAAYSATVFGLACAIGAVVIGLISDKIGPYSTTMWLGIFDGILLVVLALAGTEHFAFFIIIVAVQGFTYNGMCALNPIMMTDSFHPDDLGAMMAIIGVGYTIVGIIGPQIGLDMPYIPMLIFCAVCSVVGGILSKVAAGSLNKYYERQGSKCRVK